MKQLLVILSLGFALNSFQQRADLTIGFNAKMKLLYTDLNTSTFIAPGADVQLHVSKRSILGGLNLGYASVIENNGIKASPYHLFNADGVIGWMFVRKPAIKAGINAVCSYSVSLNKSNQLNPASAFYRNNFTLLPEVYCRYKFARIAINYNLPIAGSRLFGPGLEIGILF